MTGVKKFVYFIHQALLRLAMQRNVTDGYCERLILIILQLKPLRQQRSEKKKRPKKPAGSWIYPLHPCAPDQWLEFPMHPDFH